MRLSTTAIALAALVSLGGCDREEPQQTNIPRPPAQRTAARPDSAADSARVAGDTARAGRPGGQTAQRPGGQGAAQPGTTRPGGQTAGTAGQAGGTAAPAGSRLYTVQVAAFTSPDSARKWMGRLNSMQLPVWTSMAELGGTTYYRVRVGAAPTVADARRLGTMLSQRLSWPVWVAPVTPSDRLPDGAVDNTRRVLGGD